VIKFNAIELNSVKGFPGLFRANFDENKNLSVISGTNGSGKSTVLRSLVLVQKAYFALQLEKDTPLYSHYWNIVSEEVKKYLRDEKSYIGCEFSIGDLNGKVYLRLDGDDGWKIDGDKFSALKAYWNIDNPSALVLYLDASKTVLEEEIRYTNLNMSNLGKETLAIRLIFTPQYAFSEMYKQTIQDYIVERLSPSTPPRTLYQNLAKSVFSRLLGGMEIANFSARLDEQVTLLARRTVPERSAPFDIRDLSSGEKTLYFTLSYLFMANTVGCLIIDEPENHFHEDLLLKFITFLGDILNFGDLKDYLTQQNLTHEKPAEDSDMEGQKKRGRKKKSQDFKQKLTQVFLLTHSKTLIYHTFSIGSNYVIRYKGKIQEWAVLAPSSAESVLRELGLSSTLHRILFVEGKGDSALLSKALASNNVVLRPLDGGSAVKDMFKRLSAIRNEVKGITFGFLIDSDDKAQKFIDELEAIDPVYYKSNFCLLERHEIENYLLDEKVFFKAIEAERQNPSPAPPIDESKILAKLVEFSKKGIHSSFKKSANSNIEMAILNLLAPKLWGNKKLNYESDPDLNLELENISLSTIEVDIKSLVKSVAQESKIRFFNIKDADALARCDGKQALSLAADHFSRHCGVTKERFMQQLYANALSDENTDLGQIVKRLKSIFP